MRGFVVLAVVVVCVVCAGAQGKDDGSVQVRETDGGSVAVRPWIRTTGWPEPWSS